VTSTSRLETFSDGVFAIAITLLVLGIHVPARDAALGPALLEQWPVFLAYLVSFLTIGIMWINHHKLFEVIGQSTTTFAFINVVFLMIIAFVPYPTEVLAERLGNGVDVQLATVFYGATMTLIAVLFNALWLYAASRGGHLLRTDFDPGIHGTATRGYQFGPLVYLAITATAFLSPLVAMALFLAYGVYWVLPASSPLSSSSG
jgi:uncharacterized membrane protein